MNEMSSTEDQEFHWLVGQSLTPKEYKRLGQIWEVGRVWMSTKALERPDDAFAASPHLQGILHAARIPGGTKRKGLAKEEDLLKKESPLSARLFGKAIPTLSKEETKK